MDHAVEQREAWWWRFVVSAARRAFQSSFRGGLGVLCDATVFIAAMLMQDHLPSHDFCENVGLLY